LGRRRRGGGWSGALRGGALDVLFDDPAPWTGAVTHCGQLDPELAGEAACGRRCDEPASVRDGVAGVRADTNIVCFLDGDGSDVPAFLSAIVSPIACAEADFVMGSRLRGNREPGSMTPQQIVAGRIAGALMRLVWGVRFTDMSPFRAMHINALRHIGMRETTYGWNLEMQMRAAAAGLRILEVPVDHRCRRGGVSKVSGNLTAGLCAAWEITTTFLRLAATLRTKSQGLPTDRRQQQDKSGAMHV